MDSQVVPREEMSFAEYGAWLAGCITATGFLSERTPQQAADWCQRVLRIEQEVWKRVAHTQEVSDGT